MDHDSRHWLLTMGWGIITYLHQTPPDVSHKSQNKMHAEWDGVLPPHIYPVQCHGHLGERWGQQYDSGHGCSPFSLQSCLLKLSDSYSMNSPARSFNHISDFVSRYTRQLWDWSQGPLGQFTEELPINNVQIHFISYVTILFHIETLPLSESISPKSMNDCISTRE